MGINEIIQRDSDKYFILEGGFGNYYGKEQKSCSSEKNSYYWLSYDGLKKIISINPYDNLESEQTRIEKRDILLLTTSNVYAIMVGCIQW